MIHNSDIENRLTFAYTLLISMINNGEPHHEQTLYSTGSISSISGKQGTCENKKNHDSL